MNGLVKWQMVIAVVVLQVTAVMAEQVIYAAANAPAVPTLEQLPLQSSVSQYGITWTFAKPVRVGQFVTGDYYVVGPVTVVMVDPQPIYGADIAEAELDRAEKEMPVERLVRNGSMLNPPARQVVAYDSGIKNWYRPELRAKYPVEMKAGDVLLSTISLKQGEVSDFVYHSEGKRDHHDDCPTRVGAVLTCVDKPLAADAFRPGYLDGERRIYHARDLRREVLLKMAVVGGAPYPEKFAEVFEKVWLDSGYFGFDQPMENMPHYGQFVGMAVGNAALLLNMDYTDRQKERLLLNFVQVGIDYWGAVRSGHPGWEGWGGHGSGRKLPIVLSGVLLGDDQMANVSKHYPKTEFGEDNQTMYGECWTGAKVVFAGHSGVWKHTGEPPRKKWGPYEHLHPKDWDKDGMRNMQSEAYRRANTSSCWVGQALVLRMMGLEQQWGHDAFFDYVDRWMYEDDKAFRHEINKYFPNEALVNESKTWFHQRQGWDEWVTKMWYANREKVDAPIDGWR